MSAVEPTVVFVSGVAGSGKTTVGRQLCERLRWRFIDADDLHPAENVSRMRAGAPLTDADRESWRIAERIATRIEAGG